MTNFFMCFTNLLDFWILRKYLQCFSHKRKLNSFCRCILFFACVIGISFVNFYQIPNLNLLCSLCLIYLYSLTFSYSRVYYIILPALYIGLGFIAEPIGFLLTYKLGSCIAPTLSYYISVIICEILRYILAWIICRCRYIQLPPLPLHMSLLLFLIPLASVVISCITIYMAAYNSFIGNVLCLAIIILILLTNILTFSFFYRLSVVISNNYKNELLLQEANAKEQYYHQIEENNKVIQKIKHDLKNRLIALYAIGKNDITFQNEFKKLMGDLDNKENAIYTANVIINTILNNKLHVAQLSGIKTNVSILVPKQLNLDYSDAGILFGNLLDNAIEACTKVPSDKKWITIDIICREHLLILRICNSKDTNVTVDVNRSSKHNFKQHGIGIQSVKNIIEKYNGTITFLDLNEKFEVCAVLYGIKGGCVN